MDGFDKLQAVSNSKKLLVLNSQDATAYDQYGIYGTIVLDTPTGIGKWINSHEIEDLENKPHESLEVDVWYTEEYDHLIITNTIVEELRKYGVKKVISNMSPPFLCGCSYDNIKMFDIMYQPYSGTLYYGLMQEDKTTMSVAELIQYSRATNYPLEMYFITDVNEQEINLFLQHCSKTQDVVITLFNPNENNNLSRLIRSLFLFNGKLSRLFVNFGDEEHFYELYEIVDRYIKKGSNARQRDIPGFEREMIEAGFEEYL